MSTFIPNIPGTEALPGQPEWLRDWLDSTRQWVRVRDPRETTVGSPNDKFLTRAELLELGVLLLRADGSYAAGRPGGSNTTIVQPGPGAPGTGGPAPDLTPPPTPTGLAVDAAISNLIVQWPAPTYTVGRGHGQTNIYGVVWLDGAPEPVFADARLIDNAVGGLTIKAFPTNPGTRWKIWIKWQSRDGVESTNPAGGIHGVEATTGQDVTALLDVLTGAITESQLFTALQQRITLIDGPDSLLGSVAQRVKAERDRAVQAEGQIAQSVSTLGVTVGNVATGAQATAEALDAVELIVSNQTSGNAALAQRTQLLEAAIVDPATGLEATASALDVIELIVSDQDRGNAALAFRASGLEASVNTPNSGNNPTFARVVAEENARASLDGSVQALYTLRVVASGAGGLAIGGIGLAATSTAEGGPEVEVGVLANRFFIAPPPGVSLSNMRLVVVQATDAVINGVLVPAGLYVDTAFIRNGTITNAKLGNASIDDAKVANLSAAKLTAGDGTIGGDLKSANFIPGSEGWRVRPDGQAEFNGVVVRGAVFATSGVFNGRLQNGNIALSGSTVTGSGQRFNEDGTFVLGNAQGGMYWNGAGKPVLYGFETAVASLSTYSVNFNANSAGVITDVGPYDPVRVYVRNGALDETATWTVSISAQSESGVASVLGSLIYISGFTQNTAWVDVTASKTGFATQGPMRLSLAKILAAATAPAASASPSSISVGTNGTGVTQNVTVTASGGTGPYTYNWTLTKNYEVGGSYVALNSFSGNVASVTVWQGEEANTGAEGELVCTVIDGGGRVAIASVNLFAAGNI